MILTDCIWFPSTCSVFIAIGFDPHLRVPQFLCRAPTPRSIVPTWSIAVKRDSNELMKVPTGYNLSNWIPAFHQYIDSIQSR